MLWIKWCDFRILSVTDCHTHGFWAGSYYADPKTLTHTHTHHMKIITIQLPNCWISWMHCCFWFCFPIWLALFFFNVMKKKISARARTRDSARKWFSLAKIVDGNSTIWITNDVPLRLIVRANRRFVDLVEWLFLLS